MTGLAEIAFPLRLSFQVAVLATVFTAIAGVALAYLFAFRDFRGKSVLEVLVTLPMVLPPVVTGYYLLQVVGRTGLLGTASGVLLGEPVTLTFTWQAAVLAAFAVSMPLTVRTAQSAFEGLDRSLLDSSLTLGRSEFQTFWFVVLPLSARGIMAGLVLSFARALGEFGATIVVAGNIPGRTNTMPLELYTAVIYGDWRSAALLVGVFTAVSAAFLLAAGRLGRLVTP